MNFLNNRLNQSVVMGILVLSMGAFARAEPATPANAERLQQLNIDTSNEIRRLETESRRLKAPTNCDPHNIRFAPPAPPRRWHFMTEYYGLPIVGF
ncbi:MAG: hypothetical protein ABL903_01915 [Methylococcales bacterium]